MNRKEFTLKGLGCANCAAKIEHDLNQLGGIQANINFMSSTLSLEFSNEIDEKTLLEQVEKIVHQHEVDVCVVEKITSKAKSSTLILDNLGCANCAAKIEREVNNLEGVTSANVDFISKKLTYEVKQDVDVIGIISSIESIVKRIEPDARVCYIGPKENKSNKPSLKKESHLKEIVQLILGAFLFVLGLILPFPDWADLIIFLIAYMIVGGEVVLKAFKKILKGDVFSEQFLMTVATIGAFAIREYAEGVAVMLFYLVGELFEDLAVDRSRRSISKLMDIRPDYANLKVAESITRVSPETIQIGDVIVVKPGERIPLDGIVIDGASTVDTSALTGESLPRSLKEGSEAFSGFINKNGVLTIKVTKVFGDSTVSKVLDLVENASSKKAPTEKFITKFARYYTPAVVFIALALALIPPLVIPGAIFSDWLYRALVFLVVSCPCALVLSIPLGFIGGIGGASKKGVLVKGGNYLEALSHVEMVVFDKTGTLTKGIFKVTEVKPSNGFTKEQLIEATAYAESYSTHPIATSIIDAFNETIDKNRLSHFVELEGLGIKVYLDNKIVLVGNARLMTQENIRVPEIRTIGTLVHVSIDGIYAGYIVIADEIKDDATTAIGNLNGLGINKTVMLTGDKEDVARSIAATLRVDAVYAELMPADKVTILESLEKVKSKKGKLVFVGDGINDAPVLARADIGIAMGGLGSDAAIEAADIVIMNDEPAKIVTVMKVAKRTRRIVIQNIIFALGVKLIFLILGALGIASMWMAVFGDVGVALLAILNAMRAMNVKNIK